MSRAVSGRRVAQAGAVTVGVLVLAMCASTVVLDTLVHTPGTGGPVVESLSLAAAAIPATSVGVLLAARRPGNPIGWLLFGILIVGASPSNEYDILAYRMHPGTLPLGWVSVVLEETWPLFLVLVAVLLWVFPDGKLPAGRGRRPSVILLVVGLLLALTASSSGVVVVARHDVHISAKGRPRQPAGRLVRPHLRRGHRAVPGRLAGLDRHPGPDVPPRRRRAPPAAQVAV